MHCPAVSKVLGFVAQHSTAQHSTAQHSLLQYQHLEDASPTWSSMHAGFRVSGDFTHGHMQGLGVP